MSDWWTTTPAQSTEDTVPAPTTEDDPFATARAARNRAMVEEIQRLMDPITITPMPAARPGDPARCKCHHCRDYGTARCSGRCSDCGRLDCAQCRRNYGGDTCGECEGEGCRECCDHDIGSCCGWCDVCESHVESNVDRYDVCDKGHCHTCDHECSEC